MTALLLAALLGAVIASFLLVWYYGGTVDELKEKVDRGKTAERALEEERADRAVADASANRTTEARWKAEVEEAKNAKDVDVALARWRRVRRSIRLPTVENRDP